MSNLFGEYESFFPSGFRSQECIFKNSVSHCLTPGTEDRFKESVYFASLMESGYHDPQKFRYALGGFLAAFGSIAEIMRKELESRGRWKDWKEHLAKIPEGISNNEYATALTRARNTNIHQKSVFDGSICEIGIYRVRNHKLSLRAKIDWDIPSPELLDRLWSSEFGQMMLDEEHSAIGEQYGVRRTYRLKEISKHVPPADKDLDILQIIRRALVRTYDILGFTHTMDGDKVGLIDGGEIVNDYTYAQVAILLETDVRPHLLQQWDWPGLGDILIPVPNY